MSEPRKLHVSGAIDARTAVLHRLAARHDHFAELEQVLIAEGRYGEAQGAHVHALWLLRAYQSETDDPTPEGL